MKPKRSNRASALIIILVAIVMVTILCVAFLNFAGTERRSSRLALNSTVGRSLASLGADAALAKLKYATEAGMQQGRLWSSEPGRIRIFQADDLSAYEDVLLFSALPGPDVPGAADVNSVDLNKPSYQGKHPIAEPASSGGAAPMKIGWIDLRANPGSPSSRENPIIGRVAYWVDDESCKININVADGSKKDTNLSFGFGTPSEVSLEALRKPDGTRITNAQAAKISEYAWTHGFNSSAEITRAALNGEISEEFFEKSKFALTHYSKAPEISFMGDPRIYLFPVLHLTDSTNTRVTIRSMLTNAYGIDLPGSLYSGAHDVLVSGSANQRKQISDPVDFVYPASKQIEQGMLAKQGKTMEFFQYGRDSGLHQLQIISENAADLSRKQNYEFAARIAKSIKGVDSLQGAFDWPAFDGSTSGGFAGKYNDRQIDSLALQILDIGTRAAMGDEARGFNLPTVATDGILSGRNAIGIGRTPKFTEFLMTIDAQRSNLNLAASGTLPKVTASQIPKVRIEPQVEYYFPENYEGLKFGSQLSTTWRIGNNNSGYLNNAESGLNTPWRDALFSMPGIDLAGRGNGTADASPMNHSYMKGRGATSVAGTNSAPLLLMSATNSADGMFSQGEYRGVVSDKSPGVLYFGPDLPTFTQFTPTGGIAFWSGAGGYGQRYGNWDVAPLDSLRGSYPNANPSLGFSYSPEDPATIESQLKEAVIPVPAGFAVPIPTPLEGSIWHAYVPDPLVNKFPGDWIVSDDDSDATLFTVSRSGKSDAALDSTGGANRGFNASEGGDPLSIWMPRLDVSYPKQSRFPSVGALNYVRSGVAPDGDPAGLPALSLQHGIPWRNLSFAQTMSAGQRTSKGCYPDWAMFDLFTVPFLPQRPFSVGNGAMPKRMLTGGGATEGRVNINNPAIPYPFSETLSESEKISFPARKAPLEALFYRLRVNEGYTGDAPKYAVLTEGEVSLLAQAVQKRAQTDGPFVLSGQLAELNEVDAFTYKGVASGSESRNDLLKQILGATTVQSNVFSIWVVAQTVKKKASNLKFGEFEPGDIVTDEVRRRYIVERFIDLGADGVPGNAVDKGPDGVVGTEDDVVDERYNPPMTPPFPYVWKIVSMEDIQR